MRGVGRGAHSEGGWGGGHTVRGVGRGTHSEGGGEGGTQ